MGGKLSFSSGNYAPVVSTHSETSRHVLKEESGKKNKMRTLRYVVAIFPTGGENLKVW